MNHRDIIVHTNAAAAPDKCRDLEVWEGSRCALKVIEKQ